LSGFIGQVVHELSDEGGHVLDAFELAGLALGFQFGQELFNCRSAFELHQAIRPKRSTADVRRQIHHDGGTLSITMDEGSPSRWTGGVNGH